MSASTKGRKAAHPTRTVEQVRLPDRVETVVDHGDFDPETDIRHDRSGHRYSAEHLERLADEAERVGPPQELRRGRPSLGADATGHSPRLSTRVPQDVDDAVRAAAAAEGVTPAQWLREAIHMRLAG